MVNENNMVATFKKGEKIVITDPCYIFTEETRELLREKVYNGVPEGWEKRLKEVLSENTPIKLNMRTGYGDWTNKMLTWGVADPNVPTQIVLNPDFCADGGEVCAIALSDLEKYNPNAIALSNTHTAAVIDCFTDLDVEFLPDDEWSEIIVYMSGTRIPVAESLTMDGHNEDVDNEGMVDPDYYDI